MPQVTDKVYHIITPAFPEVKTTDTNPNTNIHQLVDKILIQDNNVNESPATCSSGSALFDLSKGIPLGTHVGQKNKGKHLG